MSTENAARIIRQHYGLTRPMSTENAARIIRQHYGLTRPVTPEEVAAELANLRRRADAGTLDDRAVILAARLGII